MADFEIGANKNRVVQVKRTRLDGWTKAKREHFLIELAVTCNVGIAAERAGMNNTTVYRLRKRDADFAAQWREALQAGYDRLEAALLRRALTVIDGSLPGAADGADAEALPATVIGAAGTREPLAEMSVAQAIDVMTRLRPQIAASKRADGRHAAPRVRPTPEQTNAEIMRRIAIVRRQRASSRADQHDGAA